MQRKDTGDTMQLMAERIRLTFDVPDRVRRALNLAASGQSITVGEVIEQLVVQGLPDELKLADEFIARGEKPKPRRKSTD